MTIKDRGIHYREDFAVLEQILYYIIFMKCKTATVSQQKSVTLNHATEIWFFTNEERNINWIIARIIFTCHTTIFSPITASYHALVLQAHVAIQTTCVLYNNYSIPLLLQVTTKLYDAFLTLKLWKHEGLWNILHLSMMEKQEGGQGEAAAQARGSKWCSHR